MTKKRRKRTAQPSVRPYVPTYRAMTGILAFPEETADALDEAVRLQAETISPFEEGEAAVGYETVGHRNGELWVMLVIVPVMAMAEQWHGTLTDRRLIGGVRIDLSALAWCRALRNLKPELTGGNRLVIVRVKEEQLLMLLHDGAVTAIRSLAPEADDAELRREALLLMAKAAISGADGAPQSAHCFTDSDATADGLADTVGLTPETVRLEDPDALLQEGLRLREAEGATLDLTPETWIAEARAAAALRRLKAVGIGAAGLWLLCAATLFILPRYYAAKADDIEARLASHSAAYAEVLDLQRRVQLIARYQDRSLSALEMLRLICEDLSEGMTFMNFNYRQGQYIRVSGTTPSTADVYALKDRLQKDVRIAEVKITRLVQEPKTGLQRFDVEILFPLQEETP